MYYTGIDLYKKTSYITTVDEMGRIVAKANLVNHEDTINRGVGRPAKRPRG